MVEPVTKIQQLIDTLERAGISLSEAARLLPISRATLHNWKAGKTDGDPLRVSLVHQYTLLIGKAVDQKRLPLSTDIRFADRVTATKTILKDIKSAS